jgi:putative tryptophan/tyrosine transport system substrate-binding protein
MWRRNFLAGLGATVAWLPSGAYAQDTRRVYRVGLIRTAPAFALDHPFVVNLLAALAPLGYELDRNLVLERRGADTHPERMPQLIDDLVASKVDVIVANGYPSTSTAKQRTSLPIVSSSAGDPVGTGLVASLARPGGTITGISDVSAEMTPKRMQLLTELTPHLRRVAVLWNAADPGMTLRYRAAEAGALAMNIAVKPLGVREPDDFEQAFAEMDRDRPDAILMVADGLTNLRRQRVYEYAAAHRLPVIYEGSEFVREGGLMSYGPLLKETCSRIAALVDRILKGAKPSELPFEQPTRFEFAINLKTAKMINLEVPATLLARADLVVE